MSDSGGTEGDNVNNILEQELTEKVGRRSILFSPKSAEGEGLKTCFTMCVKKE